MVKNLDFACDADTDTSDTTALSDNNEHSTSRLVVDDGQGEAADEAADEPADNVSTVNENQKNLEN